MRRLEAAAVVAGAAYLVVLGWAMQNLSYDIWGALVVVPVLAALSLPLINRAFAGDLAVLRPWVWAGLFAKFAGSVVGYYLRFDAYGGAADAGRYDAAGSVYAAAIRSGAASPLNLIPRATDTAFIEQLTGTVYTIVGSSRLGGFMVFTWMSFWGLVFFVRAAHHAIPGLATRRYTVAVLFFPSLVYWGSSIGKEAWMGLCLGLTAWGAALVLARRGGVRVGVVMVLLGLLGAARVRPHFAAIWAGAILFALVLRVVLDVAGRRDTDEKRRFQVSTILLVIVAGIGFAVISTAALEFLPTEGGDQESETVTDQLSTVFTEVERRTGQGGSSFDPVGIDGPWDWPYAAVRTLTRPLLVEANSLATLLPAIEMTGLLLAGIVSWRRLLHAPKLMLTVPYVVFAALCVFTWGVAFASIGNLGILTRQRSLILPLLLVFWCLPPIVFAGERRARELAAGRKRDDAERLAAR